MRLIRQTTLFIALFILTISNQNGFSQTKCIVVDKETRQPIPYVSIYTKTVDKVVGEMSNEQGVFNIGFSFNSLYFSHISYEKFEILKENIKDTVFLTPRTTILGEVIVNNKQPEWINKTLKNIIDQKTKNYQTKEKTLSYSYETYTLNDSNGYAFKSKGNLVIPQLKKNCTFKIDAQINLIKYKDKTAGVDFSNLKRMLYDDFMINLDSKFIKENQFNQNYSFENDNKNIIQLSFESKKFKDDNGSIILDTLKNVILEIERNSGTDFNIKTQTSSILRNLISSRAGFNYEKWITKTKTTYEKVGESYCIIDCKYKFYMKTSTKNKKVDTHFFTSIESELSLSKNIINKSTLFKTIPKPYYLVAIMTKKMRQDEDFFNNVSVNFEKF